MAAGVFGVLTGACLLAGFLTPIAGSPGGPRSNRQLALSKLPHRAQIHCKISPLGYHPREKRLLAAAVMLLGPPERFRSMRAFFGRSGRLSFRACPVPPESLMFQVRPI